MLSLRCSLNFSVYFLFDLDEEALNNKRGLLLPAAFEDHSPKELDALCSNSFP
jgi:hypothetical protein